MDKQHRDLLKSMVQDFINQRTEAAQATCSQYLAQRAAGVIREKPAAPAAATPPASK